jgi:hypothetical protein
MRHPQWLEGWEDSCTLPRQEVDSGIVAQGIPRPRFRPKRLVVSPFTNLSSDSSLNTLAALAA